jgi:hypothetical protein
MIKQVIQGKINKSTKCTYKRCVSQIEKKVQICKKGEDMTYFFKRTKKTTKIISRLKQQNYSNF